LPLNQAENNLMEEISWDYHPAIPPPSSPALSLSESLTKDRRGNLHDGEITINNTASLPPHDTCTSSPLAFPMILFLLPHFFPHDTLSLYFPTWYLNFILSLPLWFLSFPSLFPYNFWAFHLSFPMFFEHPLSISLWFLSFHSLFLYDSTPSPPSFPHFIGMYFSPR
jgi:hypothetical protein